MNRSAQRVIEIRSMESLSKKIETRANSECSFILLINLEQCVQLTYWFGTESVHIQATNNPHRRCALAMYAYVVVEMPS